MTRKDYDKFAAMLALELSCWEYGDRAPVQGVIRATASIFAQDNPRFDRARFYDACGL